MAQTVGRRPLTGEARFNSGPVHVGFMVEKVQLGKVFLRLLRFSPASVITLVLRTHFTDHDILHQDERARPAHLQRKQRAIDNKGTFIFCSLCNFAFLDAASMYEYS